MKQKLALFALLAALGSLGSGAALADPAPIVPTMKAEASVTSELVRIGDLIDNAGPAASIPVFHAPDLGSTGTIQTHRVIEAARTNGIFVFDTRDLNEVVIIRATRTIPLGELERAVAEAAVRQLGLAAAKDISVSFDRDVRPLQIEPAAKEAPRIAQFNFDPRTQRFDATVEVQGSTTLRRKPVRVSGTLVDTAEVVTLARAFNRGETVRESDILVERMPRNEITADTIGRPEAIIGQAARRALRAGQTIRPVDLMKPDLVGRNDTVTILFEVPGIVLTARGKALAAGAEGDLVPVLNPQSKRVVQATVDGPGRVVVGRTLTASAEATGALR
jgi:flagella basal body P-ring formation protein FlgA